MFTLQEKDRAKEEVIMYIINILIYWKITLCELLAEVCGGILSLVH